MTRLANRQDHRRRANLRRQIISGGPIVVKKPLPGLLDILAEFGIDPTTVFIPDPELSQEENDANRSKWRGRRRYIKERKSISNKYKERGDKKTMEDREQLEKAKKLLAKKLASKFDGGDK